MPSKDKVQAPIRLYKSDYDRIKEKIVQDKVTFQKVVEVLLLAYIKGNKEIQNIVTKYADEKNDKKRRYSLDEVEVNELLRYIEEEESPLRNLDKLSKEIDKEDGQNIHPRNRF